jgi:hypothetical protein
MGCPGREILSAIAAHRMSLSQAEPHLDHLTSCSPCYRDFLQAKAEYQHRRTRVVFAVAAGVLIVAGLAMWAILRPHGQQVAGAVIDLRDRSMARGTETQPSEPPLDVPRNTSHLDIYLPLGSSEGSYDVHIMSIQNEPIFNGTSDAKIERGLTLLPVDLRAPWHTRGSYVLEVRKHGGEWASFPLRVR